LPEHAPVGDAARAVCWTVTSPRPLGWEAGSRQSRCASSPTRTSYSTSWWTTPPDPEPRYESRESISPAFVRAQQVRRRDPLDRRDRGSELASEGGQRDVDNGRVEDGHDRAQHDDGRQRQELAGQYWRGGKLLPLASWYRVAPLGHSVATR